MNGNEAAFRMANSVAAAKEKAPGKHQGPFILL